MKKLRSRRQPLTPVELAVSGIMAGLSVAMGILGVVLPVFQIFFHIAATLPVAMVAVSARRRALIATFAATIMIALAVGGAISALQVFQSSLVGACVGLLHRHRRGVSLATLTGLVLGVVISGATLIFLSLFSQSRILFLNAIRSRRSCFFKTFFWIIF